MNYTSSLMLLCAGAIHSAALSLSAGEALPVQLQETAGIRRFGYPVGVSLKLPRAASRQTPFRLLDGEKPVAAQFRPVSDGAESDRWWLDFNVNLLPYESRTYRVEYGGDVPAGAEPSRGLALTEVEGAYRIANAPYIFWTVPRNLQGLLQSVTAGDFEQLKSDSPGLILQGKDGTAYRLAGDDRGAGQVTARVVRQGPLAIALRFEKAESGEPLRDVHSVVELEFVASKSWVRVDWTVDDPRGNVSGLAAELQLNLDEPTRQQPTLVDFGATTWVYAKLGKNEQAEMRAGTATAGGQDVTAAKRQHAWQILHGPRGELAPFVVGPARAEAASRPEGWAHIMDPRRCLALAMDDFSRASRDGIALSAEGDLFLSREYASGGAAPPPGRKQLRFWLHFVYNPPHISAATSPQSMQAPVVVSVR